MRMSYTDVGIDRRAGRRVQAGRPALGRGWRVRQLRDLLTDADGEAGLVHGAVRHGCQLNQHVQRHLQLRDLLLRDVHEVGVDDTQDRLVRDNADALPLPLGLDDHLRAGGRGIEALLSSSSRQATYSYTIVSRAQLLFTPPTFLCEINAYHPH